MYITDVQKELDKYCEEHYKPIEDAYLAGFRAAAQDAVNALRDYATALSGIDKTVNVSISYDNAAANLQTYFTQILSKVEK